MRFRDQTILIIGGSSGIGLATARLAIKEGARVAIVSRHKASVDEACANLGNAASGFVADVSDRKAIEDIVSSLNRIDHFFSTAGSFLVDTSLDLEDSVLQEGMNTRFWAVVNALRSILPKMNSQSSVVLMSGTANWRPEGSPVGMAAVGAVETFVRSMAVNYGPVRFNCIAPGLTRTPFLEKFLGENPEGVLDNIAESTPLKRLGTTEEIADAVLFLMHNSYVNGITLTVDGGARLT